MKFPSATLFNGAPLWLWLREQRGVFSPFMFGLIMATNIFSVVAMQWAKRDLALLQTQQAARAQAEATDIAKAVEFAILTETASSYDGAVDINRALGNTALSRGRTRGQEGVHIVTRDSGEHFDLTNQRVAITTTDDPLLRSRLSQAGNAADLGQTAQNSTAVAVVDTGAIRQRQVLQSKKTLETMAEQVYQFYAGHLRFPSPGEYDALADTLGARDVWGNDFTYTYLNENEALIEFTTPWNYTHSLKLNLTDE
jgi:hypothetical protein